MPLPRGTRLGPYEVAALIGVGGMGEVYRATDTNLKRDVAIKVLPESFLTDADRLARFQREAEMLAALNHQNISHIYGLERAGSTNALVMELVEGPTLADRIAEGPLPYTEALPIMLQIADALEAAHERSIVHRDLKPANIKLRPDGTIKILDFGIAKALQPVVVASGPRDTQVRNTPSMTELGFVLGTAAYMSPEQARGKFIDKRTDVWAFGCVLYEALTGKPAFEDEDATATVARVLEREVDMAALPRDVPPAVRKTLTSCLQKDPKKRLRDIGDVRLVLSGAFESPVVPQPKQTRRRQGLLLAAAFAGGTAVVALAAWWTRPAPELPALTRLSVPVSASLTGPLLSISADGKHIAYRSGTGPGIVVHTLDEFEPRTLSGTDDATLRAGCFSPDGEWLAFTAGVRGEVLKKVPLAGGGAVTVAQNLARADVCDWGDDGYIYFNEEPGIMRVPETAGVPELVAGRDNGRAVVSKPQLLPGGKLLYSWFGPGGLAEASIEVMDLSTRESETVVTRAGVASFVPATRGATRGYLLYGLEGTLFAAPFDSRTLATGPPRPVASDVIGFSALSSAAASASGALAYLSNPGGEAVVGGATVLVEVQRDGAERAIAVPPRIYAGVELSPDGRRAAVTVFDPEDSGSDVWIYELDGDRLGRLTVDGLNVGGPWSPDGQRVVYMHADSFVNLGAEFRAIAADGSGAPSTLRGSEWVREFIAPATISPSGDTLLVVKQSGASGDIAALGLDGALTEVSAPRDLAATQFRERFPVFSPDGRYVAYSSDESGQDEIYVMPFPGPGGKSQVSRGGGAYPRWNRNGRELFYLDEGQLMSAEVETAPTFRALAPRALFKVELPQRTRGHPYDVSPDGTRFLMVKAATAGALQTNVRLRVVANWMDEIERTAAGR